MSPRIVILQHIARAMAAELMGQWGTASDSWLDAFAVAVREGWGDEARGHLAASRDCGRRAMGQSARNGSIVPP